MFELQKVRLGLFWTDSDSSEGRDSQGEHSGNHAGKLDFAASFVERAKVTASDNFLVPIVNR